MGDMLMTESQQIEHLTSQLQGVSKRIFSLILESTTVYK